MPSVALFFPYTLNLYALTSVIPNVVAYQRGNPVFRHPTLRRLIGLGRTGQSS